MSVCGVWHKNASSSVAVKPRHLPLTINTLSFTKMVTQIHRPSFAQISEDKSCLKTERYYTVYRYYGIQVMG
jgi:hypothetical protein